MKNQILFRSLLVSMILGAALVGCGKDDPISNNNRQGQLDQNQVEAGTYTSERCFMDKIATQTSLQNRWATASLTINADGTGSLVENLFSDNTCTTAVTPNQTTTFSSVTVVDIDAVKVLKLQSSGNTINPVFWVPVNLADGGYSLDVDFTDGQSGAYIVEPTAADLDSFKANPGQGVAFKKQ